MFRKLLLFIILAVAVTSYAGDSAVKVEYDGKIEIHNLHKDVRYVLNRKHVFTNVPQNLLFNQVTIMNGSAHKKIKVTVPDNTVLHICLDSGLNTKKKYKSELNEYIRYLQRQGWRTAGKITTSDTRMKYLRVFTKMFYKGASEEFLGLGFPGVMIIAKSIELEKAKE